MSTDLHVQFHQIADGLAETGYAIIDSFLAEHEVEDILQSDGFKTGKLHFKKAGIGKEHAKQINELIRGDFIQWIDPATAPDSIQRYVNRLRELIPFINENLFLSLKDAEVHMTVYPPGAFYRRHLDQFTSDDHRKLSVICYLNREWRAEQGGQLRIHLPEGHLDVLPLSGRLVCFRSDQIEHEVLPASRERLSLTGWIIDRLML